MTDTIDAGRDDLPTTDADSLERLKKFGGGQLLAAGEQRGAVAPGPAVVLGVGALDAVGAQVLGGPDVDVIARAPAQPAPITIPIAASSSSACTIATLRSPDSALTR